MINKKLFTAIVYRIFSERWIENRKEGVRTFPGILGWREMFVQENYCSNLSSFLLDEIYNTNKSINKSDLLQRHSRSGCHLW